MFRPCRRGSLKPLRGKQQTRDVTRQRFWRPRWSTPGPPLCYAADMFVCVLRVVCTGLVLSAMGAHAQEVVGTEDHTGRHAFRFGVTQLSQAGVVRGSSALAGELSYSFAPNGWRLPLSFTGGLRGALPQSGQQTLPIEVFGRTQLVARFGYWRPSLGPELGVSGLTRAPARTTGFPGDLDALEDARATPLYLSFDAAPLQFQFGRVLVSALELSLGSTLFPSGGVFRADLGLLHVGYTL